jgi:hypothetical protein
MERLGDGVGWALRYRPLLRAGWWLAVAFYAVGTAWLLTEGEWEVALASAVGLSTLLFLRWHWRASGRAAAGPPDPPAPRDRATPAPYRPTALHRRTRADRRRISGTWRPTDASRRAVVREVGWRPSQHRTSR